MYRSVPFEQVHGDWMHLIPKHAALVLDVGAGSGRDAEWFSRRGNEVVAVEPCAELRQQGTSASPAAVRWLDDSLPALSRVQALGFKFDLILVSAVWMHVPPSERPRALRKLAGLLRPGGLLVFSLRETPFDDGRAFHSTSLPELWAQARGLMLEKVLELPTADHLCRPGVKWTTVVYRMPDDGTGALPLLRHIILNDAKSSTYKPRSFDASSGSRTAIPASPRRTRTTRCPSRLVGSPWYGSGCSRDCCLTRPCRCRSSLQETKDWVLQEQDSTRSRVSRPMISDLERLLSGIRPWRSRRRYGTPARRLPRCPPSTSGSPTPPSRCLCRNADAPPEDPSRD
ncbi:MAG: class I SAM-dependent methyltransferase [Verrucomicrobiia bacterium]